jgi:hypothetical protein
MPKDYQEATEVVEKAFSAINDAVYTDAISLGSAYDLEKAIWVNTLLTYGNARVEEIIKIADGLSKEISDPFPFDNGYTYTPFVPLTDLIKAIKK